jgi:AcrR family transcriptional regulator
MSRVAAKLGVATMSLYRYVHAKEELLALMVDSVFAEPPAPATSREGWRRALLRWARAHLDVLRRHPWVVRVPTSGPPVLPNQVLWFERGIACMAATRLAERDKLGVLLLINGFVRNEALLATDIQSAARASSSAAGHAALHYGQLLSQLIDAHRFPALHALVRAGVFDFSDSLENPDSDFKFGLARILDGVDSLLSSRRRRKM